MQSYQINQFADMLVHVPTAVAERLGIKPDVALPHTTLGDVREAVGVSRRWPSKLPTTNPFIMFPKQETDNVRP